MSDSLVKTLLNVWLQIESLLVSNGSNILNYEQIRYYIRIRNNFKVYLPDKNKTVKVFWLFNSSRINEFIFYHKIVKIK